MNFLGHSGCKIELVDGIVKKSCPNLPPHRFIEQVKKQEHLYHLNKNPNIIIPEIYDVNENQSYFTMGYIKGRSFEEFLLDATKNDLDVFTQTLIGLIDLSTIEVRDVGDIIQNKFNKIVETHNYDWLTKAFDLLFDDDVFLPMGWCHGDLTLSNMIFIDNNKLGIVDFLDSYIESPMIDIVKIRQDTKHYWTSFLHNIESQKIKSSLDYIDKEFSETMGTIHYDILQLMNLARILPYAKEKRVIDYVKANIMSLTRGPK